MKDKIRIIETEGRQAASARELHQWLETQDQFAQWAKRMFEYGFTQGTDYEAQTEFVEHSNGIGGRNRIDYILTIETAKEISMLQRTDKGKEARQYFMECEKQLKKLFTLPQTFSEALRSLADATEREDAALLKLSSAKKTIEENKPKTVFADSVIGSQNSILLRDFAKLISDKDFKIGQNRLFLWMRKRGFLMRDNKPYQKYVDMGLFEVIERAIGSGVQTFTSTTTKITGKGQIYFANKLKKGIYRHLLT
jgi:anti-repressor protein